MRRALALCAAALLAFPAPDAAASRQPPPSDGPEQRIDSGQTVATDRKVLAGGHADIGPRFADGEWTLMVHDDSAEESVWRHLDRTVFHVSDDAVLPIPDDPAYSFLGEPGKQVYVVPQVQHPEVVWIGWNTQDPKVMDTIDGGVTLTLSGVDGPGELFVYLQAGNFGDADVLWDSTRPERQDIWVEVNTHTHANWVFTEPGVYLVGVEVTADLVDRSTVTDTKTLRLAVGDTASTDAALAATPSPTPTATGAEQAAGTPAEDDTRPPLVVFVIGAVALLLIAGLVTVVMRGRAAKRRALDNGGAK